MINDARPEIEKLYRAIKRIGFSDRKKGTSEQYKDAAIEFFRENRSDFKLVEESYLSDPLLYSFRGGQEKGCFIGKLLQKIAQEDDLGINNYQKLYIFYLKLTKRLKK
jgi:hypothetical protein